MRKLVRIAVLAATVAAPAGPVNATDGLRGVTWLVEDVKEAGLIDTGQTSLLIAAYGSVATTIGCNRMAGRATVEDDKLTFGPLAATRKACAPALMRQEQIYGAALAATRSYKIEDGRLSFLDESGTVVAKFAKGAEPSPK